MKLDVSRPETGACAEGRRQRVSVCGQAARAGCAGSVCGQAARAACAGSICGQAARAASAGSVRGCGARMGAARARTEGDLALLQGMVDVEGDLLLLPVETQLHKVPPGWQVRRRPMRRAAGAQQPHPPVLGELELGDALVHLVRLAQYEVARVGALIVRAHLRTSPAQRSRSRQAHGMVCPHLISTTRAPRRSASTGGRRT